MFNAAHKRVWASVAALKMFFLFSLCHQERMTFVLETPRAVSFCVHWIFVFTRLPSAALVQHPAGRSAKCRPECRPERRSALNFVNPCPAAELSWCGLVPAVRGDSVLLLGLQNI